MIITSLLLKGRKPVVTRLVIVPSIVFIVLRRSGNIIISHVVLKLLSYVVNAHRGRSRRKLYQLHERSLLRIGCHMTIDCLVDWLDAYKLELHLKPGNPTRGPIP